MEATNKTQDGGIVYVSLVIELLTPGGAVELCPTVAQGASEIEALQSVLVDVLGWGTSDRVWIGDTACIHWPSQRIVRVLSHDVITPKDYDDAVKIWDVQADD